MDSGSGGDGKKGLDRALELYERILRNANKFLHNCKNFPLEVLKQSDPSYEEIARQLEQLVGLIMLLSRDFDPMMGQKASDYCRIMLNMGAAIRNEDVERLSKLVVEMEQKPGV